MRKTTHFTAAAERRGADVTVLPLAATSHGAVSPRRIGRAGLRSRRALVALFATIALFAAGVVPAVVPDASVASTDQPSDAVALFGLRLGFSVNGATWS